MTAAALPIRCIESSILALALGLLLGAGFASSAGAGPVSVCGDGVQEGNETCDDGNTTGGDGCSAECVDEICGDGILEPVTEQCDDGNLTPDDGCAADCTLECGNGQPNAGEACDDGNRTNGDGCDDDVANGGNCTVSACGNGVVAGDEQCDDGNAVAGDGCENDCTLTPSGPPDKEQQACVNEVNKRAAAIAKAQNKETATCLKDTAKGKVADFDACLVADAGQKVQKAKDKAASGQAKKCNQANLPAFGFIDDIAAVQDASANEPVGLAQDLFGAPGDGAIADKADKTGSRCQTEVVKDATKLYDTIWKELLKSKKQALKGSKSLTAALTGAELATALQGSLSTSPKIQNATQKLNEKPVKKCEGADPAALFPGACTDAQLGTVLTCVTQRVACRACTNVNLVDGIAMDCDTVDDGATNASCP